MKVNFNVPVKDYKGDALTKEVEYKGEDGKKHLRYIPVLVKDLISEQLYFGRGLESTGNQEKDDTAKFMAVKLSERIYQSIDPLSFSAEEIVLIKQVARAGFAPGVFVQICRIVDNEDARSCFEFERVSRDK